MKAGNLKRPHYTIVCLLLVLATASFTFAGSKEDIEQVRRNVLELQQQFWNLEKSLKANETLFQDSVRKLQKSGDELRDNQASLGAKLESILNQIQILSEKLDETNRRIKELSSMSIQRPSLVSPTEPQSSGQTDSSGTAAQTQGTVGEYPLFQAAKAEYTKGKFEQALRGFQDLLDQYPNSSLADDAQFMIGESYYSMKEYVDAVAEYDKVIQQYPDSENVPGARLKRAFALFSLGKKGQSVVELQQIVQRYPNSKEAKIARERLAEFGLE